MKNKILAFTLFYLCALLILNVSIYYHFNKKIKDIDCVSNHLMKHGNMEIRARYTFALKTGSGVIKINGLAKSAGKSFILNRQVYFTYSTIHSEYLLKSKNIISFSNENWSPSGAPRHYTKFFSEPNQLLILNIQQTQDEDFLISFNDTPTFYCMSIK